MAFNNLLIVNSSFIISAINTSVSSESAAEVAATNSTSNFRHPIAVWLPYVIFTTFLLGLTFVSFVHFHRRNGHKYRRNNSDTASWRELEQMTVPRPLQSSSADVIARFMTSSSSQPQTQSRSSHSSHRQPVTFTVNANGSMVDVRYAEQLAGSATTMSKGSDRMTNRRFTNDNRSVTTETFDDVTESNDVIVPCSGPMTTSLARLSGAIRDGIVTSQSHFPSNRRFETKMSASATVADSFQNVETTTVKSKTRDDSDDNVIRIILCDQQPKEGRRTLLRRNTEDALSDAYTSSDMQHRRKLARDFDSLRRNVTACDNSSFSISYDKRTSGARYLPQTPAM